MNFQNQQPMTPDQITKLRSQIAARQMGMSYGNYTPTIGGGLQALGDGIALRVMRNRLNSQFPPAPGGGAQQAPSNPVFRNIVEGITGNRAPWQFPAAPQPQQAATSGASDAAKSFTGGSSGGLGGIFGGLMGFKPNNDPARLW